MNIVVHGFFDWTPTLDEWRDMMDTVQVGANGDCDVTINGVTKTMKEWQMSDMVVKSKREKIRNIPSIEELRKAGYKVSVSHYRKFKDVWLGHYVYMTKTILHNSDYSHNYRIDSHGGWSVLDVTTLTGRNITVKYNVPQGQQFNRRLANRVLLGKLVKELGK